MIYQPSFPSPHLNTIDATKENVFRFCVNGSYVDKYKIKIYEVETNKKVFETDEVVLAEKVYGNNGDESFIDVAIPADSGMVNGRDYKWVVKLWQTGIYDIPTVYSRTLEKCDRTNSIVVPAHIDGTVESGMRMKVLGRPYEINKYTPEFYPVYITSSGAAQYGQGIQIFFNLPTYQFVNGEEVILKNTDVGDVITTITVSTTGNNLYLPDDPTSFQIYPNVTTIQPTRDSTYATILLTDAVEYTLPAGTPYSILSDWVENDLEFFYHAGDTGELMLTMNGGDFTTATTTNSSNITLQGQYIQAEGVAIKYWQIDIKQGENVIASSGQVFNNHIEYSCDALLSDNVYTVVATIVNNNDVELTQRRDINVVYQSTNAFIQPNIIVNQKHGVVVDWSKLNTVRGIPNFNISETLYSNNMLILQQGQTVEWNTVDESSDLQLPCDSNKTSHVEVLLTNISNYNGKFLDIYSNDGSLIEVGYDGATFWWSRNGYETHSFDPYLESFAGIFPTSEEINTISSEELCCFWNNTSEALWSTDEDKYFYSYDVGKEFWWLIRINLNEIDIKDLITFTRYYKE